MKNIITILLLMLVIPVYAGQYEDALRTGEPVCLYLYTKTCKYCKQTTPVFEKLAQNYRKQCHFVIVDAESPYGNLLIRDMMVGYVPFVVMTDIKKQYFRPVEPTCVMEYACIEKKLNEFIK